MKIGIIGNADRAVAWEKNLRPHPSVSEVIIARNLEGIGTIDACILIDDSPDKLDLLLESIKQGFHSFLVSRLPRDLYKAEKIYHASEESNVVVQYSHWPTLSPDSQWMFQKIQKPRFIQVIRELSHTDYLERDTSISDYWLDELAFCMNWINGATHHVDVNQTALKSKESGAIHLFLRFDSGTTAGIFVNTVANKNNHKRTVSDHSFILYADVIEHTVQTGEKNQSGHFFRQKKMFDATKSAEIAALQFLKAVQMRKVSPFGAYDLYQTLKVAEKISKKLAV